MAARQRTRKPPDGYDIGWKGILDTGLMPFVALLMPLLYAQIDWERGWEFCDGELTATVQEGAKGLRRVDRLVKVWLGSGQRRYLYIHIEFQAQKDPDFLRRMWVYFVMLDVKYEGQVTSIALLGDADPDWRPDTYSFEQWSTSGIFRFQVVKLLDWTDRIEELLASDNIIAVATAAHLKSLATRRNMPRRKEQKTAIMRTLLEQGRKPEEIRALFRFLDLVMALPQQLQEEFRKDAVQMEKDTEMPFLSYVEQDAMKKGEKRGEKKGEKKGEQNAVIQALNVRFKEVPADVRTAIRGVADARQLKALLRRAILCRSMDEFQHSLKGRTPGTNAPARASTAVSQM